MQTMDMKKDGAEAFGPAYRKLMLRILRSQEEINVRTGTKIRMLHGSATIKIDLSNNQLPVPGVRLVRPRTAAAEIAWFISGSKQVQDLVDLDCHIWDKFATDSGKVENAYGHRWRNYFKRDQLSQGISCLIKNSTDRQIWISTWDPNVDGLGTPASNTPCPVGFTLSIVNGYIHSTVLMRSSDVFVGLPYDAMGFAMLLRSIAIFGGWNLGTLTMSLAHPHIYEPHWEMAKDCCLSKVIYDKGPGLSLMGFPSIMAEPRRFVRSYEVLTDAVQWPSYDPKPELIL